MTFMDIVRARRSVRSYLKKPVEREKLLQCLEAARLAPSACNAQPWRFIIVDDKGQKEKLAAAAFSGLFAMKFARIAPVLVAIVKDGHNLAVRTGGTIRDVDYPLLDIGIAGEHFVLQATELGLGTCWIGWFNEGAARKVLGIPPGKKIACMLSVGYSETPPQEGNRWRKPSTEMAAFNEWGEGRTNH